MRYFGETKDLMECTNKIWYILTMECIKRNTNMYCNTDELEDILIGKIGQAQKTTYCTITSI